ncbi:MAG TPA: hypothetical protein VE959_20255 [Bryobacteraceae bacterium]|nr:hypothetical protein [Bryobacteraceae bacterium]
MKAIALVFCGSLLAQTQPLLKDYVAANITAPPAGLGIDPFYKKYTDALGIPITSSEKVPDAALLVARDIVIHMLAKRPDLRESMVSQKYRVGIMAQTEMTTDLPEHKNLKKPQPTSFNLTARERKNYERIAQMTDKQYWDSRARGLGGRFTSCAEENLLGYPGTRYYGENIFVHEFSHAILREIRQVDPQLFAEVQAAYKDAMSRGMWKGQYGSTNWDEYWAEATQTWFWSNIEFPAGDKMIQSPDDLKQYDPRIYELLGRVYPDHHIPMDLYYGKNLAPFGRRAP